MEIFLFIVIPYLSLIIFFIGSIWRLKLMGQTVSSMSTQIFESKYLYWGSRLFHMGIVILLIGHLVGLVIPRGVSIFVQHPLRLIIIEVTAFAFAILTFVGIMILIIRRIKNEKVRIVTQKTDYIVYLILLLQIISGIFIAYKYRWGISWYVTVLVPYIHSLFYIAPDITALNTLPFVVKMHVLGGFLFIGIIPFSRLIHMLSYPYHYFYRKYIIFITNLNLEKIN